MLNHFYSTLAPVPLKITNHDTQSLLKFNPLVVNFRKVPLMVKLKPSALKVAGIVTVWVGEITTLSSNIGILSHDQTVGSFQLPDFTELIVPQTDVDFNTKNPSLSPPMVFCMGFWRYIVCWSVLPA